MPTENDPSLPADRTLLHPDPNRPPAFRHHIATGVRTVTTIWLAPLLLFLLLAPQQTGACAELLALRHSGRQLPPWLIVMAITGHLSLLWWPVVFFGFPWIAGGAAARFADHLAPPERPRNYAEHANRLYGRSLALLILLAVILAALFALLYALPMWLITRNDGRFTHDDLKLLLTTAAHPALLAFSLAWWLAASAAVTACTLTLATIAAEDAGLPRAARRTFSFARHHPADTTRLWLLAMLLGLPDVLLQQTLVLAPIPAIPLLPIGIAIAAYNACAIPLLLAATESLSLAQRPTPTPG